MEEGVSPPSALLSPPTQSSRADAQEDADLVLHPALALLSRLTLFLPF